MMKNAISIETDVFQEITRNIGDCGTECIVDSAILSYANQMIGTDIGHKLSLFLQEISDCSELYMRHNSEALPCLLNFIMTSMVELDDDNRDMIENLKR